MLSMIDYLLLYVTLEKFIHLETPTSTSEGLVLGTSGYLALND